MPKKTEGDDWLPALDASQKLAPRVGGLTRARALLATGLRECMLSASAEGSSISEGEDAEFVEEQAARNELLGIPADVWARSDNWEADRLRWDWDLGEFEIESLDWDATYLFHGVHFLSAEIDSLDPAEPPYSGVRGQTDTSQPSGRRGPKPSMRWAALIEAILKLERDGELVTGSFDGPGALLQRLQQIVPEERQFDDRSIEPIVSYLFEHLLCGPPRRN